MTTWRTRVAAACLALLLGVLPARAGYVTATLSESNPLGPDAPVYINDGMGGAATTYYTPGFVNWNLVGSDANFSSQFTTFCIELTQDIVVGSTYTYQLTDLALAPTPGSGATGNGNGMGAAKASEIKQLWNRYYGSIGSNGTNAAAFQLAIWKIEYDYTSGTNWINFTTGNFRAAYNPTATNLAATWLTDVAKHNYGEAAGLIALTNPGAQDQITQLAPAPSGLVLAALGGLTLLGWQRVNRTRAAAPAAVA